jgi:hypothetical protein
MKIVVEPINVVVCRRLVLLDYEYLNKKKFLSTSHPPLIHRLKTILLWFYTKCTVAPPIYGRRGNHLHGGAVHTWSFAIRHTHNEN